MKVTIEVPDSLSELVDPQVLLTEALEKFLLQGRAEADEVSFIEYVTSRPGCIQYERETDERDGENGEDVS